MVYSGGVRSFVQIAALCALALSSLPSLEAKRPTLAPTQSSVCGNSEGNKRYGVQAINDESCVKGGLGCFGDHCRYCKVLDTPKSSHLNTCLSYGVAFTSTTPVVVVQGPCTVSSGDVAAGISAVTDSSCLNGGLGCYNDHCRYCKAVETPQSTGFMACSSLDSSYSTPAPTTATPTTTAPMVAPTDAPTTTAPTLAPTDAPTTLPPTVVDPVTEAPTAIVDVPTSTPTVTEAPTAIVDVPTATPTATDPSMVAPTITSTCTVVPSAGDTDAGVNIVTDLSCAVGGLGCLSDVCRFCKVKTTPQSDSYMDCALVNGEPTPTTEAPTVNPAIDTAAPTVPDATTEAPIVTTVETVAPEIPDATLETPASTTATPDVSETPVSTTEVPNATTETPAIPDATTETPTDAPVTDTPTDVPSVSTDEPTATTVAEIPILTTEAPATTCTLVASNSDVELGISVATDPSCSLGGVGCIDDICRFCKLTTSLQSALYEDCASLEKGSQSDSIDEAPTETPDATTETPVVADTPGATTETPITFTDVVDTTTETPTVAPAITDAPVATTEAPVASMNAPAQETCGIVAAEGDIAVGIHIATDTSCSTGGVGCINELCRFCKVEITPQSEAFVDCSTLSGISDTAASDVSTPAPVSTLPSAKCDLVESSGDASVGIHVITDLSCSTGGAGCISDVCRFCKVTTSTQSAAFIDCVTVDGYTAETEPPTTITPVIPTSLTTCTQVASDGDLAVGVDITTDTSCLFGGAGCIDTVCRFCQTTATSQSASFPNCTTISDYIPRSEVPVDDTTSITDAPVAQATCDLVVSAGDAANGISITGDAACAAGGVGCIDNVCRFCKVTTTVQSAGFVDCTSIAGFTLASDVPTDTTAPSAVSISTGTDTTTPAATCGLVVAEGDAAVGIAIIADSTCQFGGTGCIDNVCRFCKVRTTDQSAAFVDCPIAAVPTVTSPVVVVDSTTAPTNTGVDTSGVTPNDTLIPVDTEAPGPDFVTKSPGTTSDASEAPGTTPSDFSSTSSSVGAASTSSDAVDAGTDSPTTTSDVTTNTPSATSNAVDSTVPGSDDTALTEVPVAGTESPSSTSVSNDSTTSPSTEEPTAVVDTSDLLTDAPVVTAGPSTNSTNSPVSDVDVDDIIDLEGSDGSDSTYLDSDESTDGLLA
ncbi:hypothetical protein V7S43_004545 [Phytophthora oleae]|uniref:Uncharacterized protein n=1 Tax=Phytophthora oleae TaxID=2107226 RepID=A0ABD3FTH7_9STRA